jgi:glycine cleavage system H protein
LAPDRDDLRYSQDHLWFRHEAGRVTVGVTERISRVFTWVNRIDLPSPGTELSAGDELATIDSQKAVFVLPAPVPLEVVAVNDELSTDPMLVRMEPLSGGWLLDVSLADGGWEQLLEPDAYLAIVAKHQ